MYCILFQLEAHMLIRILAFTFKRKIHGQDFTDSAVGK